MTGEDKDKAISLLRQLDPESLKDLLTVSKLTYLLGRQPDIKPFCFALVMRLEDKPSIVDFCFTQESANELAELHKCGTGQAPEIVELFTKD